MKRGRDFIGVGVGAVIVNDANEVLLLQRRTAPEPGCWTIPGGAVEFGETIEDALLRELQEELGIECRLVRLLRVTNHILPTEHVHWVSPAFLVRPVSGTPANMEPEKHADIRWFLARSLPDNVTLTTRLALQSFLEIVK